MPAIERILFTEEEIHRRIRQVAAQISADYAGRELKLVGVLKGSVFFLTALARELTVTVTVDFLGISSFSSSAGRARDGPDLEGPGRRASKAQHVLLVEDIIDTGFTTRYLLQHLSARDPKSLAVCTLLDRTPRRIVQIPLDYRCFEIPDRFVVGFGLDYRQMYRNLKYVAVLNPES